jgi:signal transduction histidine kinase
MKIQQRQMQLAIARGGVTNPGFEYFNHPLTGTGPEPRSQRFQRPDGRDRSASVVTPAILLGQVVETLPCSAVIEERNRLAREIHDTLAQEFAGILLHLEAANPLNNGENASECLARARELAKCGLEDARRLLLGLRPKSLEGAHLSVALGQLAERFSRDCGIHCAFNANGRPHALPKDVENELYRVAQEALCNVRKHSRAASVSIALSYNSGGVVLAIKDDGQGFAMTQHQAGAHGFGVPTMCDRAYRLGGRMDINTGQGTGTEVRMSVPLPGKTSKERNNQ